MSSFHVHLNISLEGKSKIWASILGHYNWQHILYTHIIQHVFWSLCFHCKIFLQRRTELCCMFVKLFLAILKYITIFLRTRKTSTYVIWKKMLWRTTFNCFNVRNKLTLALPMLFFRNDSSGLIICSKALSIWRNICNILSHSMLYPLFNAETVRFSNMTKLKLVPLLLQACCYLWSCHEGHSY